MSPRALQIIQVIGVLLLMAATGIGVYLLLGTFRHSSGEQGKAVLPDKSHPLINLSGTVILAQDGNLYQLQNNSFTQIANGGWSQPAIMPDHQHLLAVKRVGSSSDIYLLGLDGSIQSQLTYDVRRDVSSSHWSFYPHPTNDGQTIFYSFDPKYTPNTYTVNLSTYSMPLGGNQAMAHRWTYPTSNNGVPVGTGGDLQPLPLASEGFIETRYEVGAHSQMYGQIWLQTQPARTPYTEPGHSLTPSNQSCYSPALSPDGSQLAMVCNNIGDSTAKLNVASFDGTKLGPLRVVTQGTLNSPAWSSDGKNLLYLAAQGEQGYFQLFELPLDKGQPRQVTEGNNFDATSPPVWF